MSHLSGKLYESDYEEAVVELLRAEGWEYTHGEQLHRMVTDTLYEDDLRMFLKAEYADKGFTEGEIDQIVSNLKLCSGESHFASLRNTVQLYQNGYDYTFTDGRPAFKLHYINYSHPERNIFRVVNQYEMHQGTQSRIPDVMLLVNGIPVCIFELKNPTSPTATIRDAHTQIYTRYVRDIPSLMKFCALAVISDGSNTRLGCTISPFEFFYAWKKVDNEDKSSAGLDELRTLVKGALTKERLLEILRDYVYFPDPTVRGELEVVCRYPQFFAARKLRDHIVSHLRSVGGDGKGGTYFGATGCGKTYTMLFLARQLALRCKTMLGSPTVLLIVDREDLETQAGELFANSKQYLQDDAVRIISSREDLRQELSLRKSGGFYITTIQKFTAETGLLSDRTNIICLSDEAHRTQNNLGSKLSIKDNADASKAGAFITYGFAKYLRDALPEATYVGFTGTPIDETVHVFGEIVDQYTMLQAKEDGITVPISYVARLARCAMNEEQAREIEKYYLLCADDGASKEDIEKSKKAMSSLQVILGDPGRLRRVAKDIITDYETRCADRPDILQKAMITCSDRIIAYRLLQIILQMRPEWGEARKSMDDGLLTKVQLEQLTPTPFINLVATRNKDDEKEMYEYLGEDSRGKELAKLYKNNDSNFRIAMVVDMWITGFDAPALTFLYNDKPLQKHTLIQTISRVNRRFGKKDCGVIIDYIGIRENMKEAMKRYGGDVSPKDDVEVAKEMLINELHSLQDETHGLDFTPFFKGSALARLQFLQTAGEYLLANSVSQKGKPSLITLFKGHVRRLRSAYNICHPAGVLDEEVTAWCQCFMGIMSFVAKMTNTHHDIEGMNKAVERMVREAVYCTGVEALFEDQTEQDIFEDSFMKEIEDVKMPHTKFQMLVQLMKKAIKEYGKTNKVRARFFQDLLEETIDQYNTRDKLTFTNDVAHETIEAVTGAVTDKVNELSDQLIELFKQLNKDKEEFKTLGITFEEKAFFDILVDIREKNKFEYPDERCIELAKKIKYLIDGSSLYADWLNNDNLKSQLATKLTFLIYKEGYPPEWDEEVFNRVLEQVENYKKNTSVKKVRSYEAENLAKLQVAEDDAPYNIHIDKYFGPGSINVNHIGHVDKLNE